MRLLLVWATAALHIVTPPSDFGVHENVKAITQQNYVVYFESRPNNGIALTVNIESVHP